LGKYFLKSGEVKDFISPYKEIEHLDNSKYRRIQIAILRFEFSYNIGLIYQLIDLMIAFEALYIGDDKELAYKMATRASFLLGKTKEERTKIFNLLKKAYTLRGKLVHGGDLPKNFEISIEFISQVRKLLRDSIKKFMVLLDLYSHRELLKSILDNNVLHEGSILD